MKGRNQTAAPLNFLKSGGGGLQLHFRIMALNIKLMYDLIRASAP